jgi:hypothetical protein
MCFIITFDESDSLFQSVRVLVAIVQDVGADGETDCV